MSNFSEPLTVSLTWSDIDAWDRYRETHDSDGRPIETTILGRVWMCYAVTLVPVFAFLAAFRELKAKGADLSLVDTCLIVMLLGVVAVGALIWFVFIGRAVSRYRRDPNWRMVYTIRIADDSLSLNQGAVSSIWGWHSVRLLASSSDFHIILLRGENTENHLVVPAHSFSDPDQFQKFAACVVGHIEAAVLESGQRRG